MRCSVNRILKSFGELEKSYDIQLEAADDDDHSLSSSEEQLGS